jgi:hypothetical protein
MIVYAHLEKSGNISPWPIKFVKKFLENNENSVRDEGSPYLHHGSKICYFLMEMKWDSPAKRPAPDLERGLHCCQSWELFFSQSRPGRLWVIPRLLSNGKRQFSPERSREAHNSSPSNAEVKNTWKVTAILCASPLNVT